MLHVFCLFCTHFQRLDRTYLIKELDGTCVMAHQRESPTDTTELLTRLTWLPYRDSNSIIQNLDGNFVPFHHGFYPKSLWGSDAKSTIEMKI